MSGTDYPQAGPPTGAERLKRLEEHAGYAERAVEELAAEVRVLNQRVRELVKRLDGMEGRLGGVVERVEKVEGGGE